MAHPNFLNMSFVNSTMSTADVTPYSNFSNGIVAGGVNSLGNNDRGGFDLQLTLATQVIDSINKLPLQYSHD
jgi:hypothetical protein